jgi:transposase
MLSDAHWVMLEPLVEACRPKGKTPPQDLRRTISAILWRHQNGAKWRAIPEELGPWWRAAQVFIRWARTGIATAGAHPARLIVIHGRWVRHRSRLQAQAGLGGS